MLAYRLQIGSRRLDVLECGRFFGWREAKVDPAESMNQGCFRDFWEIE